ncbi:MAG: DUF692 domain-containing protein [Myxococcales bacterium]|nr:DUF692 domain-containing protein [Myxococcales bacterium]
MSGWAAPSFGIGLDVLWGPQGLSAEGRPAPSLVALLEELGPRLDHVFFSLQSPTRGIPALDEVLGPMTELVAAAREAGVPTVALHHTMLNLACPPRAYDRQGLLEMTRALCDTLDLAWVNEDLGYWSVQGQPLAYPLPPQLTEVGLTDCVAAIRQVQDALPCPLHVEFPGFAADLSEPCLGDWDAFDLFREAVMRSDAVCTLDVGHLLSWRWLMGHRGAALLEGWERLPLSACREIHVAGARIRSDQLIDAHDGHLLADQLHGLRWLLEHCPGPVAVTFEDPRFDEEGRLQPDSESGLEALWRVVHP